MTGISDDTTLDRQVRTHIYDILLSGGKMPLAADVARHLAIDLDRLHSSFRRLKDAHILVLQEGDQEILMANPFSAVPTPFLVESGSSSWWGNCIWDSLGIAAMIKRDARITTGCGDCNDSMALLVQDGSLRLENGDGIIHFSVPARRWWDNIKFT